jgi:hypothetical protein
MKAYLAEMKAYFAQVKTYLAQVEAYFAEIKLLKIIFIYSDPILSCEISLCMLAIMDQGV